MISLVVMIVSSTTFAGGLLTNTNQNVAFLRNPARAASIEIDAVYSNPAGLAFLKKDGLHISFNGQSAFQTRTIESTFQPFAAFGGNATKKYEGEASAPFIPSLQAAYKSDKWTFSGSFAVTGGGGKATFNKGLGSFEAPVSLIPSMLSANGMPTSQYSVDAYMEGSQIIYGLQMGATYKITDYLSAYAGVRMNYVSNGYIGHIRNIQANVNGGEMVVLNSYFSGVAASAAAAAQQYQQAGDMENYAKYMALSKQAEGVATQTADKMLDCDQTGWGVTPIIGAHFAMGKWNIGAKYEFLTKLNVENKTKTDDTGMFKDGVNTPNDIPSLLSIGVSYDILPVLRASVGYHHFFDTHAKMASNKQKFLSEGTNEYLAGMEWDVLDWMQISAGLQRTKLGVEDGYMSDMSFSISSWSYGFGAGFKLTEDLKLNVAYFLTNYEDYTKASEYQVSESMKLPFADRFTRTNKVFGIGLDYRF